MGWLVSRIRAWCLGWSDQVNACDGSQWESRVGDRAESSLLQSGEKGGGRGIWSERKQTERQREAGVWVNIDMKTRMKIDMTVDMKRDYCNRHVQR